MTGRQNDPGRRDRIIDACLAVIARDGVDGTSFRKVATEARVPLGSLTYYFESRTHLLREAFTRYANTVADRFAERIKRVTPGNNDEAVEAVVDLALADDVHRETDLVLSLELYTLAAREPEFRTITHAWMRRSRSALQTQFDFAPAWMLDALIEGVILHRALRTQRPDLAVLRDELDRTIRRIVGSSEPGSVTVGPLSISGLGGRRRGARR